MGVAGDFNPNEDNFASICDSIDAEESHGIRESRHRISDSSTLIPREVTDLDLVSPGITRRSLDRLEPFVAIQ